MLYKELSENNQHNAWFARTSEWNVFYSYISYIYPNQPPM